MLKTHPKKKKRKCPQNLQKKRQITRRKTNTQVNFLNKRTINKRYNAPFKNDHDFNKLKTLREGRAPFS